MKTKWITSVGGFGRLASTRANAPRLDPGRSDSTSAGRAGIGRRIGAYTAALCAVVGLVACSDDAGVELAGPVAPVTTARPVVTVASESTTVARPVVSVVATIGDQTSSHEFELDDQTVQNPFGAYATCSAVWNRFGAYNVLVSSDDPAAGSVQVNTLDNVRKPGAAEATARIERGDELIASKGTVEMSEDFTSGVFTGQTNDEQPIRIEFSCATSAPGEPLDRTRTFTDVAARLTRDGRERIVSTAVQEGCGEGGQIDLSPDAEHAAGRGAITAARIATDKLELWVGGEKLSFDSFSVQSVDDRSGTFRGTTPEGIAVIGAYSCRE